MSADKLVTHEDRTDLLNLRAMVEDFDSDAAERQTYLLDRLIAAAEADQMPEPAEFGAIVVDDLGRRWVRGEPGWTNLDASGKFLNWQSWESLHTHGRRAVQCLTPLRPTVTEADVERAALIYYHDGDLDAVSKEGWPSYATPSSQRDSRETVEKVLKAAGVEVQS